MNYIILDMEWNQGYPGQMAYIGDTRQALTGEIIQIGAVKLNDAFEIVDRYVKLVKPVFYPKLHFKVKELTGISKEDLKEASSFSQVLPDFLAWCGTPFQFLIWGFDDIAILKQNMAIHQMTLPSEFEWYNLQLIYNRQTGAENRQVSLQTACEVMNISQSLQLHNALHDAIYTAEICKQLDMKAGLEYCREMRRCAEQSCKRKFRYYGFEAAADALSFAEKSDNLCPLCKKPLTLSGRYVRKFVNQYAALRICETHGCFVENIAISKMNEKADTSGYKAIKSLLRSPDARSAENQVIQKRRRRRHRKSSAPKTETS